MTLVTVYASHLCLIFDHRFLDIVTVHLNIPRSRSFQGVAAITKFTYDVLKHAPDICIMIHVSMYWPI
jgi:hypothetical protein